MKKILLLDNYDSFVYNLRHLLLSIAGVEVEVRLNDAVTLEEVACYDGVVLSPGPGVPEEAGLLLPIIRHYAGLLPIFGVCLGHQAIAEALGGSLSNLDEVHHGVCSTIEVVEESPIYRGIGHQMEVGRYHSWVVNEATLPTCFEVTARSAEGEVMSISHRSYNLHGVQFHPESILTPRGEELLRNWLHTF